MAMLAAAQNLHLRTIGCACAVMSDEQQSDLVVRLIKKMNSFRKVAINERMNRAAAESRAISLELYLSSVLKHSEELCDALSIRDNEVSQLLKRVDELEGLVTNQQPLTDAWNGGLDFKLSTGGEFSSIFCNISSPETRDLIAYIRRLEVSSKVYPNTIPFTQCSKCDSRKKESSLTSAPAVPIAHEGSKDGHVEFEKQIQTLLRNTASLKETLELLQDRISAFEIEEFRSIVFRRNHLGQLVESIICVTRGRSQQELMVHVIDETMHHSQALSTIISINCIRNSSRFFITFSRVLQIHFECDKCDHVVECLQKLVLESRKVFSRSEVIAEDLESFFGM